MSMLFFHAQFISFQSVMLGFGVGCFLHSLFGHTVNGRGAAMLLGIIACFINLAIMVRIVPGMMP